MPEYQYKARDKFGKMRSGTLSAESPEALAAYLGQQGFLPIDIRPVEKAARRVGPLLSMDRVPFAELNMFTRQLYTLQKAGLPLLSGLNALKNQAESLLLKKALEAIVQDIEAGAKFSEALARHPKIFNTIYVNVVKSGEVSGRLVESLERLAALGEHDEKIRMRVQAAVRYPVFVVVAIALGFIVLVAFVMPRFAKLYARYQTELPLPTKMLLGLNFLITKFWWLLLLVAVAAVFLMRRWVATPVGRDWVDRLRLKVPVFGDLFLKLAMSRFSRITGTLLKSGIPILTIFDLVQGGVGNTVVARALKSIKESINEGKGMAQPMKASGLFPPVVTQMVAVGEETGELDALLLHVADYYDFQVDHKIDNLVSLIEPFLIFFLGCAVLFMALAIFLPMWNMASLFKH